MYTDYYTFTYSVLVKNMNVKLRCLLANRLKEREEKSCTPLILMPS